MNEITNAYEVLREMVSLKSKVPITHPTRIINPCCDFSFPFMFFLLFDLTLLARRVVVLNACR